MSRPRRGWLAPAAAVCLGGLLAACAHGPPFRVLEAAPAAVPAAGPYGLPLRSGQVVVGHAGGPVSVLMSLIPETYSPYLHAGVLVVDAGRPYIYHMRGPIKAYLVGPRGADHGGVQRTPLATYVKRERFVDVFEAPAVDEALVAAYARARRADGTPFDPRFDTEDRTRLYCTEFVAAALEAGGGGPYPAAPDRDHPSLRPLKSWLGVTARGSIRAADLVAGARPVATLSAGGGLAQARLDAAATGELHRRFTADQRLGDLFAWNGARLTFRPPILVFRHAARHLMEGAERAPTPTEAEAAARALADRLFGPLPTPAHGRGALAAAP